MFTIHKTDTGAVAPFEHMVAKPGAYKIGRFLSVSMEGKLSTDQADNGSRYLCMTEKTLEAEDVIPVVRVNETMILKNSGERPEGYDTVGAILDVSNDGCSISADGMGVQLEVVAVDDEAIYVRLK